MPDAKKTAPHVARAVIAAQAKLPPAAPARGGMPAARTAAAAAPHVARAMAGALAPKSALPAAKAPASHVARAMAGAVSPKATAPAPAAAPHVRAAVAARPPAGASPGPGRLSRLAAHLQAAQARMSTPAGPPPAAAHVAAAQRAHLPGDAVQMMKRPASAKKTPAPKKQKTAPAPSASGSPPKEHHSVKFKRTVDTAVSNVNTGIATVDPSQANFFVYTGTGIPTQPVEIGNLGKRALKLSREDSSIANLAFATKGLDSVGPEIQFGVVNNRKSGQRLLRISGNAKAYNDTIRNKIPASHRLEDYYKEALRPRHVEIRREELQQYSQHLTASEIDEVLADALEIFPDDQARFQDLTSQLAGYKVHKKFRTTPKRQRSKSARHLAYGSHKDWRIEVAANSKDIHAESAILSETLPNADEELEKVRGTKVPCVSCSTFFRFKKVPTAILEHTSGAWLSESSMQQLGFKLADIEGYLRHIHQVLGAAALNSYDGSNGEIAIKDQTLDLDPGSDSEDEEAHTGIDIRLQSTAKGKKLVGRIDKFEARHF